MSTTIRPLHAQAMARDVLRVIDIEVSSETAVVLTDGDDTGPHHEGYLVNPGQIEYAAAEFERVTGLTVDGDALVAALPWRGYDERMDARQSPAQECSRGALGEA